MKTKTRPGSAVILAAALFLTGTQYKNTLDSPPNLRDAVKNDGAFGQLLNTAGADQTAPRMDAPKIAPRPVALPRGPGLLSALHKQTTLNGEFRARGYMRAKFLMYSQVDVTEKDGSRGIMEEYSQTFMEGVSGVYGCHVECSDADGDGHINFNDYIDEDRDRCIKNRFKSSGVYPQAKCKAGVADFNHDGHRGDFVNAEHLWPQARFGQQNALKGDLYNLLPVFSIPNAERGQTPYGPGGFMPQRKIQGKIARALFYFATAYHDRIDKRDGREFFLPMVATLMDWNRRFPPDPAERRRNDLVSGLQGNRNPYVDDPSLVDQVGEAAWSNLF